MNYCHTPLCFVALALISVMGCGYGEVSPKTYEYTQALYSITNRQSTEKLAEFESKLAEAQTAKELNDSEFDLLSDIVATAKSGDWKSAQGECRELMEAQIGVRKE
ncbi:hypothetical protein [Aeoliella sp. SH292]|uniref:hypothetical protein n=1 Tax=Aeoliella sp. SH292 TaxID=3454464 RepID=UPI003F977588